MRELKVPVFVKPYGKDSVQGTQQLEKDLESFQVELENILTKYRSDLKIEKRFSLGRGQDPSIKIYKDGCTLMNLYVKKHRRFYSKSQRDYLNGKFIKDEDFLIERIRDLIA